MEQAVEAVRRQVALLLSPQRSAVSPSPLSPQVAPRHPSALVAASCLAYLVPAHTLLRARRPREAGLWAVQAGLSMVADVAVIRSDASYWHAADRVGAEPLAHTRLQVKERGDALPGW